MITTCNPGTFLRVDGSFELIPSTGGNELVLDQEKGRSVWLAELLRSFLQDLDDHLTGPVRITLVAGGIADPLRGVET